MCELFLADIRQSVIVLCFFFNVKSAELFGYQTLNKFIIIIIIVISCDAHDGLP